MSVTILLADDHEVIRYGMSFALQGKQDLEVVGEAGSGEEVLDLTAKLQPDLILLDMGMPGVSGGSLIAELRERHPATRVLVFSMYSDQARVLDALRAGAHGYVLKENQTDEILEAIRQVAAGRKYVTPKLAGVLVDCVSGGSDSPRDRLAALTSREREVITKASQGLTSKQIAKMLFISERTVEAHRANAMGKLGLHSETELGRFFAQLEALEPDT
ncbi:MAG: response regulator [Armatimonadota bacterium]